MKLVIKIGGSLAVAEDGPKYDYLSKVLPVLRGVDLQNKLSVGIGGGQLVRKYGRAISNFSLKDEQLEECFIQLINANVKLLSILLDKKPLFSFEGYDGDEVVVGGIKPGRSTDANATLVAKKMSADLFVKLTDVDGIFDKDPKKHEDAELINLISFEDLRSLKKETRPLQYGVVDPTALEIIRENRIETWVVNGADPENIFKAMKGEDIGTHIAGK